MVTYVSLLRGINVGGHHKVSMSAIKQLYASLGFDAVESYIQSGNILFRSGAKNTSVLEQKIEEALAALCGFPVAVLIRSAGDMTRIVRRNPFLSRPGIDTNRLAVAFLKARPNPVRLRNLTTAIHKTSDEFAAAGSELYLHCPNGFAKTLLTSTFIEKQLGRETTGRNWNTTTRLWAMCMQGQSQQTSDQGPAVSSHRPRRSATRR